MLYDFSNIKTKPNFHFIFDRLHRGNIGILAGIGAVGKSYFILEQIINYILFKKGHLPNSSSINMNFNKVKIITTEDEVNIITNRIQNILIVLFKTNDINKIKDIDKIIDLLQKSIILVISENLHETKKEVEKNDGEEFLILDTLSVILKLKSEIDNAEISSKIETFKEIAIKNSISILFIHHLNQSAMSIKSKDEITADKLRGATTLLNNVRYVSLLVKIKESIFYKSVKVNNGKRTEIEFENDFWNLGFSEKKTRIPF